MTTSLTLAYPATMDAISVLLSTPRLTIAQIATMDTLKCGTTKPSHSPASPASTLVFNAPMTAFVSNAKQAFS